MVYILKNQKPKYYIIKQYIDKKSPHNKDTKLGFNNIYFLNTAKLTISSLYRSPENANIRPEWEWEYRRRSSEVEGKHRPSGAQLGCSLYYPYQCPVTPVVGAARNQQPVVHIGLKSLFLNLYKFFFRQCTFKIKIYGSML